MLFLFLIPPTGSYCREDRCQSKFRFSLVPGIRAPMEECEAAGGVARAGGQARVIDAPALGWDGGRVEREIAAARPDVVVIATTFGTLPTDLTWARRIREILPETSIGLRGAACYAHQEELLAKEPAVDFCVRGDYELVFERMATDGYEATPGTVYRTDRGPVTNGDPLTTRDLDGLARPDRRTIDPTRYRVRGLGQPQATIHVQRGCPFSCTYCLTHLVAGAKARHRGAESIAEEMEELCREGYRFFYLRADTFTLDRPWAQEVCAAIRRRCPEARWVTATRIDCVDEPTLEAMKKAGCYGISFGLETGSAAIGEKVKKKPDVENGRRAMRLCDRYGILSLGYFMVGFLWETRETLDQTRRYLNEVRPDLLTVYFAHPYPGTRYHDDVAASSLPIRFADAQANPALVTEALPTRVLERAAQGMLLQHYAHPRVWGSVVRKLGSLTVASVVSALRPRRPEPAAADLSAKP
ncbi:MAG: radical SAM protein [Deltaproteobacteria bacterium]|nr:radical SAM protein [Deltaproteobacteria bacterium]